jgi:hypothetical protein
VVSGQVKVAHRAVLFTPAEAEHVAWVARIGAMDAGDERAAAQLRLQHAVEGFSVVALTYYLANLLKIVLEGTKAMGAGIEPMSVVTLALPLLAGGVWWAVRRVKRRENSSPHNFRNGGYAVIPGNIRCCRFARRE